MKTNIVGDRSAGQNSHSRCTTTPSLAVGALRRGGAGVAERG